MQENVICRSGTIEFPEFMTMMSQKILNRDPKDEILKVRQLAEMRALYEGLARNMRSSWFSGSSRVALLTHRGIGTYVLLFVRKPSKSNL